MTEALEHNLQLIAERANLPVVEAQMITARLRPNPEFGFTADHLDLAGTGFSESNGAGPPEYTVNSAFLWERGDKRKRRMELAAEERRIAECDFRDMARRLAFEARVAFVDLLLAQRNAALARENLSAMTRILEINQARVDTGDLAEVEVMRTKVAVAQLEDELTRADLAVRNARTRLHLLAGRPAGRAPIVADGDFERADDPLDAAEIEKSALRDRPDLMSAVARETRSEADVRLQMARARPDFELGTEFRRQQGVNGEGNSLGFFLSIPLQFFDRNQGEIARARAEARQSSLRTAALRAEVMSEIHEALAQNSAARERLERIEVGMLAQARQVREITEYAYGRGEARFVELLDAERAYNEITRSYLAARAEFALSTYRIHSVMGKAVAP